MLDKLPYVSFERDAFLRTAEAATLVQNKRELFLWLRLHLHRFVPHDVATCHLERCGEAGTQSHVFDSVALPEDAVRVLGAPQGPLWTTLRQCWLRAGRQATAVDLAQDLPAPLAEPLRQAGVHTLLVHGSDATARLRPEALYAFGRVGEAPAEAATASLQLWLAHLHASAVRALGEDSASTSRTDARSGRPHGLTARELQILRAVREDRRTQEIAETFGISPLTVKNHLRKVMAKLGARSRVHAVAEAMARQIIS